MTYLSSTIKEKRILNKTVLIGFTGTWIALDDAEYFQYKLGLSNIYSRLEDNAVIVAETNKERVLRN